MAAQSTRDGSAGSPKTALLEHLRVIARRGGTITYEDLVAATGIPADLDLAPLLREISTEEDAAGRGMLTAVVVRRSTGIPGGGFFDLAEQLGRDTTDRERCWRDEHARVVRAHAGDWTSPA